MAQWRKWRIPVNTMAILCLSQAFIISSSAIEPPGWMIAFTPILAASKTASSFGKNASDARQEFFESFPALRRVINTESTLDIWPAPIPTVRPAPGKDNGIGFYVFATFHAKISDDISFKDGFLLVTIFIFCSSIVRVSSS